MSNCVQICLFYTICLCDKCFYLCEIFSILFPDSIQFVISLVLNLLLLCQASLTSNDAEGLCRGWDRWWGEKRTQNLPSSKASMTATATLVLKLQAKKNQKHSRKAKPKTSDTNHFPVCEYFTQRRRAHRHLL